MFSKSYLPIHFHNHISNALDVIHLHSERIKKKWLKQARKKEKEEHQDYI